MFLCEERRQTNWCKSYQKDAGPHWLQGRCCECRRWIQSKGCCAQSALFGVSWLYDFFDGIHISHSHSCKVSPVVVKWNEQRAYLYRRSPTSHVACCLVLYLPMSLLPICIRKFALRHGMPTRAEVNRRFQVSATVWVRVRDRLL